MISLEQRLYYLLKPMIPWGLRTWARRWRGERQRRKYASVWPIDERAGAAPPNWPGWPNGKQFAFVLTHDVEGPKGLRRVRRLMELEKKHGFRSSFNFVPEGGYRVPDALREELEEEGFEVGVHGLTHDGKMYFSRERFAEEVARIQEYVRKWDAAGFRSPLMHHEMRWMHLLGTGYDSSTFDTDPFEPMTDGAGTIFPFWIPGENGKGLVELPYTLVQDFTLFLVLQERGNAVWKQKLDWIAEKGGMALLNVHPDYMALDEKAARDEFPVPYYEEFLEYARDRYGDALWHALPKDVARYYESALPPENRNTRRKICMLTHSDYASDNRVRRYAELLARQGDQVDVLCLSGGDAPLGEEVICGVRAIRIQKREYDERGKWSYAWKLTKFFVRASWRMTRLHAEHKYDLIHIHNIPDFLVFAALFPKWTGAKLILDIHDIVPELFAAKFGAGMEGWYARLLKLMEKASASFADHVIVANHIWHQRLIERSVEERKCSVVLNHVDPVLFYQRSRTREDGRFVMIFPGTFQWHQGLDIAVRALALLKERIPEAELHLYGGGGGADAEANLAKLAEELGLNGRVRFCGSVTLDEVPEVIANADLGVVPKRADSFGNEAYSTKIMEFMSQGIPVVASRTMIDQYYFHDGLVQFFPSGDSEAMAAAILELFENRERWDALVKAGLEYARENGWDKKQDEYAELVRRLTTESFEG